MFTDPVCGAKLAPNDVFGATVYKGTEFYFCSFICLLKFHRFPDEFAQVIAYSEN